MRFDLRKANSSEPEDASVSPVIEGSMTGLRSSAFASDRAHGLANAQACAVELLSLVETASGLPRGVVVRAREACRATRELAAEDVEGHGQVAFQHGEAAISCREDALRNFSNPVLARLLCKIADGHRNVRRAHREAMVAERVL